MQRQRFEMKYLLNEDQAVFAREFIGQHLELDENGVGKPYYSYPVHSLYLDSDRLTTFWSTVNGEKNRFKLRLRFYNEHVDSPVFFEVKRRMNNCILKQRGGVHKSAVALLLAGHLPDPAQLMRPESKHLAGVQNFLQLANQMHARPQAHVAYLREAYVDPISDSVRVTMDRNVLTEIRTEAVFQTEMQNPSRPFGDQVILELKFTNRFPEWFRQFVEHYGFTQCGAAKYCEGIAGIPSFGVGHAGTFRDRPAAEMTEVNETVPASKLDAPMKPPPSG